MIAGLLLAALVLGLASPAGADVEDGVAAYERGDYSTALKEWRPLAEQGDALAQHYLGFMYFSGYGVPQDHSEGVKWYRLAADQGLAESQWMLGFYYQYRDAAAAIKWYRLAAEQGYASAQFSIADMYYMGEGVPQDYAEAAKWYQLAAAQGDIGAQDRLGDMYMKGRGVPQNYAEAAKWFHSVAEQSGARQQTLCELYMEGKGVPQDYVQAHMWCSLAALGDNFLRPRRLRDELENRMTPAQIAEAENLAREWIGKHKKGGPDDIVACDLGRRGVIHTRRTICAKEGGRPDSTGRTGASD